MTDLKAFRDQCRAPGIYLDIPEDEYHADPSLSSHGLKDLIANPLEFWMGWAGNPYRTPDEKTEPMIVGTAYHIAFLEPDRFHDLYAAPFEAADHPDAYATVKDIRAAIKDLGEKPKGTSKADLMDCLRDIDPDAVSLDELKERHVSEAGDRIILPRGVMDEIMMAEAELDRHSKARNAFRGGIAEVSIFWICPETGLPMKARLDYLKATKYGAQPTDLKTMSPRADMPPDRLALSEFCKRRYDIQFAQYVEAYRQGAQFSNDPLWHCDQVAMPIVFITTGPVPVVIPRIFETHDKRAVAGSQPMAYYLRAVREIALAKQHFIEFYSKYGAAEPWRTEYAVETVTDDDLPLWFLDARDTNLRSSDQ